MNFVFLHIEKSAGTSQRAFFKRTFGDDNVFWWGLNSDSDTFNPTLTEGKVIIGGHRNRGFYDNSPSIFSSIVREPFDRVTSLFNFFVNQHLEAWKKRGLDPNSLLNTLQNSSDFVELIKNGQCRYISGEASFNKARELLNSKPFFVGSFDNLELYNFTLCQELNKPKIQLERHNVGKSNYKDSILINDTIIEILAPLLEEDKKLYNYINQDNDGLFNSVPTHAWEKLLENHNKTPHLENKLKAKVFASKVNLTEDGTIDAAIIELQTGFLQKAMHLGVQCFNGGKLVYEQRLPIDSLSYRSGAYYGKFKLKHDINQPISNLSIGLVNPSIKQWLTSEVHFFELSLKQ